MRNVLMLFLLFLFCHCNETKTKLKDDYPDPFKVTVNSSIVGENRFKLIIDVVVLKNDKFQLYYKEYNIAEFSANKMTEVFVNGSTNSQKIIFSIPSNETPTHLRLDFGANYSQEVIKFNNMVLRYGNKEYEFDNEKFAQLFKSNKYTSFDEFSKKIKNKVISERYDPHYISINLEEIIFQLLE